MSDREKAKLLLDRASRRMTSREYELCHDIANSHVPRRQFSPDETADQAFDRILIEFAEYLK